VDDMRGAGGEVDGDEMRIAGDVGPAVHDHEVLDRLAGVIDGGSLSRQRMGGVEGEDLVGLAFEIVRIAGGGVEARAVDGVTAPAVPATVVVATPSPVTLISVLSIAGAKPRFDSTVTLLSEAR